MIYLPFYLVVIFELLLFFTGASIYSFLEVIIDRVPRKVSFIKGRSVCDSCGHELGVFDLIPVFSWLFLGGKCRYCKSKIPATLFFKEIAGGLSLALGVFFITNTFGFSWQILVKILMFFIFGCVCNVTGGIYIKTGKIGLTSVIFTFVLAVLRFLMPIIEGHVKLNTGYYNSYYSLYGGAIMLGACVIVWFIKDKMRVFEWLFLVSSGLVLGGGRTCASIALFVLALVVLIIYKKCKKMPVKRRLLPYIPVLCFSMQIISWALEGLKIRF